MSRRSRLALALALVAASVLLSAPPANAHDVLLATSPAQGAVVRTVPDQVVLTFNEQVAPYAPTVIVTAPDGTRVQTGAAAIVGPDVRQTITRSGGQGTYTVAYRIVSADGHPISGSYTFRVGAISPSAPALSPRSDPAAGGSGAGAPALAAGAGVLVLLAVVAVVVTRGRRRRATRRPATASVSEDTDHSHTDAERTRS